MVGAYEVVMSVLLLFPWFLVLTTVVGAMWTRVSSVAGGRKARKGRELRAAPWALRRRPLEFSGAESRSGESA